MTHAKLLGKLAGSIAGKGSGQEVSDFGGFGVEQHDQRRDVITVAGQGRLEVIDSTRQDLFDDFDRDALFAEPERVLESQGQMHLDLQRRAQPFGQQVDCVCVHDVRGLDAVVDTGFQEPGDELAPVPGHAFELERSGAVADLLHLRPAQVVAQLRIANQQHRQHHAGTSSQFHQSFESGQRLVVQLMSFIDDQHHGMLVLAHQVPKLALAPFGLLGDLDFAAVTERQVVEHGLDQGRQRRPTLVDG